MEILEKDTTPEFDVKKAPEVASEPALTAEQYKQMAEINAKVRDLKQIGFDIREYLDGMKKEVERLEGELVSTRTQLEDSTKEMQDCFDKFIYQPFGITGQISIADTEPHYITQQTPAS